MSQRRIVAIAVVVLAVVLGAAAPSGAHPGLSFGAFDPASVGWASVRDATEAQFHDAVDARVAQNMIMVDLEADSSGGGPRFGGVFQRNTDGRGWIVDVTLTEAELATGPVDQPWPMRLVDVEVYERDGVRTWAALWVQNVEGLATVDAHDLTYDQAVALYQQQGPARLPIDVDVYPYGAGVRYALIWLDNSAGVAWYLHLDQSSTDFASSFDQHSDAGFRPLMVDSATRASAGQRYASIWLDNTSGRSWREKRDLTSAQYATWWSTYSGDGLRLITFERYETAAGTRYVGVWREN